MSNIVNTITEVATLGLVKDVTGVEAAQKAAGQAASLQAGAAQTAEQGVNRRFDITQESLRPFQEAGVGALGQQQALLGLSGQDEQQQAFAAFNESPGQAFLRERGQRNLLRNASAIGGLGGGNVRSALVQQGVGFAQQDFQNQFSRLGQLAGQGQAATTNIGQFGAQAAQQAGQLGIAGAEARASGILGQQQAEGQFRGQLLQLGGQAVGAAFSDRRLKKDIKLVGNDKSGNLYEFRYKDSDVLFIGRMAQELQEIRPDAISVHKSGFLQVSNEFAPRVA